MDNDPRTDQEIAESLGKLIHGEQPEAKLTNFKFTAARGATRREVLLALERMQKKINSNEWRDTPHVDKHNPPVAFNAPFDTPPTQKG